MAALALRAYGMVTAVGFTGEASCAAMRAGISGASEANLWDPYSSSNVQAARAPLRQWWEGAGKLIELLAPAVHECLMAAEPVPPEHIPVVLGLPTAGRPFRWPGFDEVVLTELSAKLGVRLHSASRVLPRGNTAAVVGLQIASQLLGEARIPRCIVAGVDSFLQQKMFRAYNEQKRVLTPANSNGFVPGEAGAAVLVAPAGDPSPDGDLLVLGTGLAQETAKIASEEPLRAEGLTAAVKEALDRAGLKLGDVSYRITDLNGEHYKFKEAMFIVGRLLRTRREDVFDLWHPAEYVGECGAAIGPLVLGWALHAARKSYARGPVVLCHFSDDDGERAAAVLRWRPSEGDR